MLNLLYVLLCEVFVGRMLHTKTERFESIITHYERKIHYEKRGDNFLTRLRKKVKHLEQSYDIVNTYILLCVNNIV